MHRCVCSYRVGCTGGCVAIGGVHRWVCSYRVGCTGVCVCVCV